MTEPGSSRLGLVGGSSLLAMLAVLCLTVFALLALSTVQAQSRLSCAGAAAVEDYYRADAHAHQVFAKLRAGELPPNVEQEKDLYSYTCSISPNQHLAVQVCRTREGWQVLRWQTVSIARWEEESLSLWDGETGF